MAVTAASYGYSSTSSQLAAQLGARLRGRLRIDLDPGDQGACDSSARSMGPDSRNDHHALPDRMVGYVYVILHGGAVMHWALNDAVGLLRHLGVVGQGWQAGSSYRL